VEVVGQRPGAPHLAAQRGGQLVDQLQVAVLLDPRPTQTRVSASSRFTDSEGLGRVSTTLIRDGVRSTVTCSTEAAPGLGAGSGSTLFMLTATIWRGVVSLSPATVLPPRA